VSEAPPPDEAPRAGHGGAGYEGEEPPPAPKSPPVTNVEVRARDFKTSCSSDSECVLIFQGNICAACQCGNAAINRSDYPKYQELVQKHATCRDVSKCAADCIDVAGGPAKCRDGRCLYVIF
jgi:hypothetical protein